MSVKHVNVELDFMRQHLSVKHVELNFMRQHLSVKQVELNFLRRHFSVKHVELNFLRRHLSVKHVELLFMRQHLAVKHVELDFMRHSTCLSSMLTIVLNTKFSLSSVIFFLAQGQWGPISPTTLHYTIIASCLITNLTMPTFSYSAQENTSYPTITFK